MTTEQPEKNRKRTYASRNYIPQVEDFYGLYKLYEFADLQADRPSLWDEMMAHEEAQGNISFGKFDTAIKAIQARGRTYRDKSSTVTAILTLYASTPTRKGMCSEDIATELNLKPSYVESIIASYKPLPENPFEVVKHFPIEFIMWCPPGEAVQIYWKHRPARSLAARRQQDCYIKKLKKENFPAPDILHIYKLGYRAGDTRLAVFFSKVEAQGLLNDIRKAHPERWKDVIELNLANIEVLLLTDQISKGQMSEESNLKFQEAITLQKNYENMFFGQANSIEQPTISDGEIEPQVILLHLMEEARIQRICHLLQIEMKHIKVPKSLKISVT